MTKPYDQTRAFEVASFKAAGSRGEFEALVSVFGNVDLGGDRVMPGAFDKSIAAWQAKGDPIPIIWNHMWDDPEAHIGEVDPADMVATKAGLLVKRGRVDMDRPFAEQVFHLLERRRVKEFSFGYNVPPGGAERKNGALELSEIELFEIGPTLKGMNPATELLAVKALAAATDGELTDGVEVKAGARHSKETLAALSRLRDELDALIAAGAKPDDETASTDDAKALGTASDDPDADLTNEIQAMRGKNRV